MLGNDSRDAALWWKKDKYEQQNLCNVGKYFHHSISQWIGRLLISRYEKKLQYREEFKKKTEYYVTSQEELTFQLFI